MPISGDSQSSVTQNLPQLPSASGGVAITWSSSKPMYLDHDGKVVKRPDFSAQPVDVVLTATLTRNEATDTKSYTLTILPKDPSDAEAVQYALDQLAIGYATGDSASGVTGNLALNTNGAHGVKINWESLNETYLSNDGKVTRPSYTVGSVDVTLTATVTKGSVTNTKTIYITIVPNAETDHEAVQYAKDQLAIGYAAGDSASSVTGNLALDTNGAHDATVAWSSGNIAVITNAGVVSRPTGADVVVTLTASVTKGMTSQTATYALTVKGMPEVGNSGYTNPTPPFEMTNATKSLIQTLGTSVIVARVEQSTNSAGDTVTKVNQADVIRQLGLAEVKAVIVPVAGTTGDKSVVSLTPGLLAEMKQKDQDSKFVFQNNGATYELPATFADTSAVAKALGLSDSVARDAELRITFATILTSTVEGQLANAGGTVAAPVISFSIEIVTPDKTYEFNQFQGTYINRSFELNQTVDSTNSVGVVLNPDGSVMPVPTIFTTVEGMQVAILKVDHNSVYTVITRNSQLSDIGASWAKESIKVLANKMIIDGYKDGTFKPNDQVTRAEFASMLSQGLGLKRYASATKFSDVSPEAWYAGVVGAMASRGFIGGYVDGSFKADRPITREEEAVILGRVLAYLKKDAKSNDSALDSFRDGASISEYAKASVATLAELRIMDGDAQGNLNPQGSATRAETATLIYKLLKLADLLN